MTTKSEVYNLGRDNTSSARLTLQHWLTNSLWGLIHPNIIENWNQERPAKPKRIADVACGNAVWCVELSGSGVAEDLEVIGFDVSNSQFPPQDEWPSNVKLKTWDMFKQPPQEYEQSFDLVNIRHVVLTIPDGDPRPILRNALKLLKPGGILHWLEFDCYATLAGPDSAYRRVFDVLANTIGRPQDHRWIQRIDNIFEEHDLQDVHMSARVPPKHMRKYWTDNHVVAFQEMLRGYASPEIQDLYVESERERTEKGMVPLYPLVLCFGNAPE